MNMKHQKQLFTVLLMSAACMLQAQRSETLLDAISGLRRRVRSGR